jgi:DNA-binding transcriptional ArsR family regulator
MEYVFEIIAEPNRRAILSLLVSSQRSVGEMGRQLRIPQPTVSANLNFRSPDSFLFEMAGWYLAQYPGDGVGHTSLSGENGTKKCYDPLIIRYSIWTEQ